MSNMVTSLRSANISCWVFACGRGSSPIISLGGVSDIHMLEFVTESCNGCVLDHHKVIEIIFINFSRYF